MIIRRSFFVIRLSVFLFFLLLLSGYGTCFAEDVTDPTLGEEVADQSDNEDIDDSVANEDLQSYFSNPAQAAHAANLSEKIALENDQKMQKALDSVAEAEEGLAKAVETEDGDAIKLAEEQLAKAQGEYAETMSNLSGVTTEDILDMREAGLGWGNIAHELGVHPGLLGLGKSKGKQKNKATYAAIDDDVVTVMTQSEIAEATARDTKSGWSKGHGHGVKSGVHAAGSGLTASLSSSKGNNKGGSKSSSSGYSGAGGLSGAGSNNSNAASNSESIGKGKSGSKSSNNSNKGPGNSNAGGNSSNGNKGGNKGGNKSNNGGNGKNK
ncbi:MAG: hypothetical protein GY705_19035 [Bacteroidetes bacterium]|nr:hypothetical protein [Bacteroidota bacterium]